MPMIYCVIKTRKTKSNTFPLKKTFNIVVNCIVKGISLLLKKKNNLLLCSMFNTMESIIAETGLIWLYLHSYHNACDQSQTKKNKIANYAYKTLIFFKLCHLNINLKISQIIIYLVTFPWHCSSNNKENYVWPPILTNGPTVRSMLFNPRKRRDARMLGKFGSLVTLLLAAAVFRPALLPELRSSRSGPPKKHGEWSFPVFKCGIFSAYRQTHHGWLWRYWRWWYL